MIHLRPLIEQVKDLSAIDPEMWSRTLGHTPEEIIQTIQSIETDRSTKCVPDSAPGDHLEGK